jgi:putative phosphoesterase
MAHGHRHDRTSLGLLAREAEADLVVVGHSHTPGIDRLGDARLVNPGSHADPRGGQAAHAEVERDGKRTTITLASPEGETLRGETFAGD